MPPVKAFSEEDPLPTRRRVTWGLVKIPLLCVHPGPPSLEARSSTVTGRGPHSPDGRTAERGRQKCYTGALRTVRRERGKEGEKGRKGRRETEQLHLQEGVAPATLQPHDPATLQYSLDLGQQGRVSTLRGQARRCLVSRDVCLHPRCRFCRGQGTSGHVPEMPARGLQGQRLCCASPSCPYFAGATRGLIFLAPARRISYRNCP